MTALSNWKKTITWKWIYSFNK